MMLKLTTKTAIERPVHFAFLYGESNKPKPNKVKTVSIIRRVALPKARSVSYRDDSPIYGDKYWASLKKTVKNP